ncbi:MAG: transcriptional repressor [Clostridia bacterium]|nr:transcriptional repressor [Clostridia bacterium]MBQ9774352.1 transcriptional repressor [Clostridia bacterium]
MKRNPYKTVGRVALTRFLQGHPDRQFTAEELYEAVSESGVGGRSSVYRHLSELCESDTVRRFRSAERGCNVYQYIGSGCDCRDHFHEKCVRCGRIRHLDCHATAQFIQHLMAEHGFCVDCGQSILYGVCAACRDTGGAEHA